MGGLARSAAHAPNGHTTLPCHTADRYWVLAHREDGRRHHISEPLLRLGLAAAVVGELVLGESVNLVGGTVAAPDHRAGTDPVHQRVLADLRAVNARQAPLPVRVWIEALASDDRGPRTVADVLARLAAAGMVTRVRGVLGSRAAPYGPLVATAPGNALWRAVQHPGDLVTQPIRLLAGLAAATGLYHGAGPVTDPGAALARLRDLSDGLEPDLHTVINALDTAAATLVAARI